MRLETDDALETLGRLVILGIALVIIVGCTAVMWSTGTEIIVDEDYGLIIIEEKDE